MDFALGSRAATAGFRLLSFGSVGSTNEELMLRARAGEAAGLWLVAREQTRGRGRRGRPWATPTGNLAASVLATVDPAASRTAATLGFVAGLALHDALGSVAPEAAADLRLKWPNDVLHGGAKLAGILLEAERLGDGRVCVVVGIGANVAVAPDVADYPATSLADLGISATPEELFTCLTDAWAAHSHTWAASGLASIRRSWLDHAVGIGGPVSVRVGERTVAGRFDTIDDDGRLVVATSDGGREAVSAAEVHFGAARSTGAV